MRKEPKIEKRSREKIMIRYRSRECSLEEWAKSFGLPPSLLRKYIQKGISGEVLIPLIKDILKICSPDRSGGIYVTIHGVTKTLKEWAEKSGLPYSLLYQRLRSGSPPEYLLLDSKAFRIMQGKRRKEKNLKKVSKGNPLISIGGETKTLREWAETSGIPYITLYQRIRHGWKPEELLLPIGTRRKKVSNDETSPKKEREAALVKTPDSSEDTSPARVKKKPMQIELDGKSWRLSELEKMFGIPITRIYGRLRQGKTGWQLLFPKDPTYLRIAGVTMLFKEWQQELGYSDKEMVELYWKYQRGLTKEEEQEIQKQRKPLYIGVKSP